MLPLLFLALLADLPERCSVSGTVVDSVTGKGIAKVEMALEPFDRVNHHTAVTESGAEGRFSMVDVECGPYRLIGDRARYLEARRVVLKLDAGARLADVRYRLVPAGAISGTVRDAEGEPVPGAHMIVARRNGGQLQAFESIDADDQGNYRFGYLRPGTYVIAAEPRGRRWNAVDHSSGRPGTAVESPILTFHPAAAERSGATAVTVAPGAQVGGVDVRMLRSRVYRVRGTVEGGGRLSPMQLMLRNDDNLPDFQPTTFVRRDGQFEFLNVPPGSYWVGTGDDGREVKVSGADVEGLRLALGSGAAVEVSIRPAEGDERRITGAVQLTSRGRLERMGPIGESNSAELRVPAGLYQVGVMIHSPADVYVKSIRAGAADVLADGLAVAGAAAVPVQVVLARAGEVRGVVLNERDEPAAGVTVVLAPGLKSTVTDQEGHFTIQGIGPGEYRAYAWDDVEEDAWREPEFLGQYEAQRVTVADRERTSVRLRLSSK